MSDRLYPCWLIVAFLLMASLCRGQDYGFVNYGFKDGLKAAQILNVTQDHNGYLWLSTNGAGIIKFDGINYTPLTVKQGLSNNTIFDVVVDHHNNLYVATEKGINYITKDSIIIYDNNNGLEAEQVWDLMLASDSTLWIATTQGVYLLKDGKVKPFVANDKIQNQVIRSIIEGTDGAIWFGSLAGIYHYKTALVRIFETGPYSNVEFNRLICTKSGEVFASTLGEGVVKFNNSDWTHQEFLTTSNGLTSNLVRFVFEDSEENIWISMIGEELAFIPRNERQGVTKEWYVHLIHSDMEKESLNFWNAHEDREGNIWMGTYGDGLYKVYKRNYSHYDKETGLGGNFVWSIFEDSKSNVWVGTMTGGVTVIPNKVHTGIDIDSFMVFKEEDGMLANRVHRMYEMEDGVVLIGTIHGINAVRLNGETRELEQLYTITKKDGLTNENVRSFHYDKRSQQMMIGTHGGLYVFAMDNDSRQLTTLINEENGLPSGNVFDIILREEGYWIATGNGVVLIDWQTLEVKKVITVDDGLPHNDVRTILEDDHGNLIFATGAGVCIYNYDKETYDVIDMSDGLIGDRLYFIHQKANTLWLGTSLGIEEIMYEQYLETGVLETEFLSEAKGFPESEANTNAVITDVNGNLWFGTIDGVVKFYEDYVRPEHQKPPLLNIESVQMEMVEVDHTQELIFKYNQNDLKVDFIGIELCEPTFVRYTYYLEGFMDRWSDTSNARTLVLNNLDPGDYTLQISAGNTDNEWTKEPFVMHFTINQPFWLSWWFVALLVLAGIGINRFYIKRRELMLIANQDRLSMEVDLATNALQMKNKEIRQERDKISEIKEKVEQQNKNITDSINYARRIQDSILPNHAIFDKYFAGNFILYRPRGIVSGDFYWAHKIEDRLICAVVDCTGHGVPGAFMSLIGHSSLDNIVKEEKIYTPNEILNELSKRIIKTLGQTGEKDDQKDGMDMVILNINLKTREIELSGARNPLWLLRDGELIEYKTQRQPVGYFPKAVPFKNENIEARSGDVIILFSDGLPDQFGGPRRKKFKYLPFKNMVEKYATEELVDMGEAITNELTAWQGPYEQTDDICILGLKLY